MNIVGYICVTPFTARHASKPIKRFLVHMHSTIKRRKSGEHVHICVADTKSENCSGGRFVAALRFRSHSLVGRWGVLERVHLCRWRRGKTYIKESAIVEPLYQRLAP